ncbi:flagellar protein FlgN [Pseudobacillus wudalianchiensis]|uniref:Flagellar biosynthesis protein FlgN n=1 Tax=Pseudobacillus wudalianchiensis TaxID=1743143 RepID=A0A1B9AYQ9_9BACI|nr:flagellar protein FlgN [Bacillus wudalianchiensis]OCA89019.1 hypothetical protein A8F95_06285 [Bacillus wudalianchiensis]
MSVQSLIETLGKMLQLQKSLFEIANQKTDIIKKGNIEALNQMMKDEQTHLAAIEMLEKVQKKVAIEIIRSEEKQSISECLQFADDAEKMKLKELQEELLNQVTALKEVNSLNQLLLEQSLQFVTLNLDLVLPVEDSSVYTKEMEDDPVMPARSLFDSKA